MVPICLLSGFTLYLNTVLRLYHRIVSDVEIILSIHTITQVGIYSLYSAVVQLRTFPSRPIHNILRTYLTPRLPTPSFVIPLLLCYSYLLTQIALLLFYYIEIGSFQFLVIREFYHKGMLDFVRNLFWIYYNGHVLLESVMWCARHLSICLC